MTNTYDTRNNVITMTNAKNAVTTYSDYTATEKPKKVTDAEGNESVLTYKVGNLIKKTNPAGQIETHDYVNNQLKTTRYYQNATAQASNTIAEEIVYTYDKDGRLKTAIHTVEGKLSDKYVYSYTNGQLTQQDTTFYDEAGTELFTKTLKYS